MFGIPSWMMLLAIPIGFFAIAVRFAYLVPLELAGEAPLNEGDAEVQVHGASVAPPHSRTVP